MVWLCSSAVPVEIRVDVLGEREIEVGIRAHRASMGTREGMFSISFKK